eukprot:363073-Chlamydomonas_euryale.AAC.4
MAHMYINACVDLELLMPSLPGCICLWTLADVHMLASLGKQTCPDAKGQDWFRLGRQGAGLCACGRFSAGPRQWSQPLAPRLMPVVGIRQIQDEHALELPCWRAALIMVLRRTSNGTKPWQPAACASR